MPPFSAYESLLKQNELNKNRSIARQGTNQSMISMLQNYQKPEPIAVGSSFTPGSGGMMGTPAGGQATGLAGQVINYAKKWMGTPYSYGGGNLKGPSKGINQGRNTVGFDCSGLVRQVYANFGIKLPRVSYQQAAFGKKIGSNQARPGDLVSFYNNLHGPNTIGHIGIYIGNGQMIEAPKTGSKVKISSVGGRKVAGYTRVL